MGKASRKKKAKRLAKKIYAEAVNRYQGQAILGNSPEIITDDSSKKP